MFKRVIGEEKIRIQVLLSDFCINLSVSDKECKKELFTFKRISNGLLSEQTLTDDSLITVIAEVESINNWRPLTPVVMDASADEPLTSNHLLLARSPQDSSSIGVFTKKDNYTQKQWRQVRYVVDQFWLR